MRKFVLVAPGFDVIQEILHRHRFVLVVQLHFDVAENSAKLHESARMG
jgi:hypothetical protein